MIYPTRVVLNHRFTPSNRRQVNPRLVHGSLGSCDSKIDLRFREHEEENLNFSLDQTFKTVTVTPYYYKYISYPTYSLSSLVSCPCLLIFFPENSITYNIIFERFTYCLCKRYKRCDVCLHIHIRWFPVGVCGIRIIQIDTQ